MLMSETICGQHCLQFFYHMKGSNLGTLNVYQKFKIKKRDRVWAASGDHGEDWNEVVLNLGTKSCYQVKAVLFII